MESWIVESANKLANRHYLQKEIEEFFLLIGEAKIHKSNKESSQIVAYNNAIRSWVNSNNGTKKELIQILNEKLGWKAVANEIIEIQSNTDKIFWNVHPREEKYIDRKKVSDAINNHLSKSNEVLITAFVGLGGIGKTTVTAEYVWKNEDKYEIIVWFDSESKENQKFCLKDEYLRFGVENFITTKYNDDICKVKNWFEKNSKWLIIFDNVTNEDDLKGFIPNRGGKVIITSRNRFWEIKNKIELEKYSLEEVNEYLTEYLKPQYDSTINQTDGEEIILKFATDLDYHPLAITHAVSYIKNDTISIKEYLEYKDEQREIILSKFTVEDIDNDEFLKSYIKVFESFMLSVKKIYSLPNGKKSIDCLNKCAFLVPEKIPRCLFSRGSLLILAKYYLITYINSEFLLIHRLVQESIRFKMAGNSTGPIDDNIYSSTSILKEELMLTYELFDKFYPIGKRRKEDVLLKRSLLPHYGSLLGYHLKHHETNITPEQTKKLIQIELEEVAESVVNYNASYSNPGNYQTIKNVVTSSKFALKAAVDKIESMVKINPTNEKEYEDALNKCLETFKKELIPNDEIIGETNLYLAFYYIRKFLMLESNKDEYLKSANEYQTSALIGKFDEAQIPFTSLLECKGFLNGIGSENNKKYQLEFYMDAYRKQMNYFQRDFVNAMPEIIWEKHRKGISLDNAVSAGRFNFPGFQFYRGTGFLNEGYEVEIFIGKGETHDGNVIPGKFIRFNSQYPSKRFDSFQCCYNKEELKIDDGYEILRMEPGTYKWVLSKNGEKVNKAISGGIENGEELYIGRVYIVTEKDEEKKKPTEPSVGKISLKERGCLVPLWNKQHIYEEYEILVGV